MREIIIPVIDFEDTSLEEAVDFLRLRSRELDPDVAPYRGVGILIRKSRPGPAAAKATAVLSAVPDPGALHIKELKMRNVSLWDALHRVAAETRCRVVIADEGIMLVPK